jgi:cyclohexanone monooxygenase
LDGAALRARYHLEREKRLRPDEAATIVADVVAHTLGSGADQVEATDEAERAWVDQLDDNSGSFLSDPDCTPGYYNHEGRPPGRRELLNASRYAAGPVAYFHYIDAWRRAGTFEGLEFHAGADRAPGTAG